LIPQTIGTEVLFRNGTAVMPIVRACTD